jgi:hypothetical protein
MDIAQLYTQLQPTFTLLANFAVKAGGSARILAMTRMRIADGRLPHFIAKTTDCRNGT